MEGPGEISALPVPSVKTAGTLPAMAVINAPQIGATQHEYTERRSANG